MTQQAHDPRFGATQPSPPGPPSAPYAQPPIAQPPYAQPPSAPYAQPPYAQPPYAPQPGFGAPQPPAPRRRTGAVIGGIVGVLVAAGLVVGGLFLFGPRTLDTAEVERQIAALTEEQVGVAASDVSCPEDVEAAAGGTFPCTGTLDGQEVSFTVEQTDDEGNVQISGDDTLVVVAAVEESVAQQVGAEAEVQAVATCDAGGRSVLVDPAGTPIPCTVTNATDSTDSADVLATVDEAGAVSYEFV
ncbi:DUF4333 domain-containing protein [Geodermatophilus sp. SYSU D01105]